MSKLKKHKFDELYKMSSGISSKPEQAGHGYPFVSFSTVFNNYFLPDTLDDLMDTSEQEQEKYSVQKGDILLTRTSETIDELGMSCVVLKDFPKTTFSGFVKRLRPIQKNITYDKYMGFYLRSKFFRKTMTNNAFITLRASLNEAIFSYLHLHLPDYQTQKNTGDFLHILNKKIELNQRINSELESKAKTLYDYWFVQFDFPNEKGKPYKSAGGKMVWNEVLKREIPLGWEIRELGDIVDIYDSKRIPLSNVQREKMQGKYPYYGATSVMDYINDFIFDGEYVLIAEDGSVMDEGGFPFVQYIWGKTWVNNHAHVLQPKDPSNYDYLFFLLKSISVVQIMTGSVQKKINQENLLGVKFATPDKQALQSFSNFARPTRKRIINLTEETQTLTELRDWLLPMLMNGQVKVG